MEMCCPLRNECKVDCVHKEVHEFYKDEACEATCQRLNSAAVIKKEKISCIQVSSILDKMREFTEKALTNKFKERKIKN